MLIYKKEDYSHIPLGFLTQFLSCSMLPPTLVHPPVSPSHAISQQDVSHHVHTHEITIALGPTAGIQHCPPATTQTQQTTYNLPNKHNEPIPVAHATNKPAVAPSVAKFLIRLS